MTSKKLWNAMLAAHEQEAEKNGAEIRNLGWSTDDYGIISKTSRGILQTEIVNGLFEHRWVKR